MPSAVAPFSFFALLPFPPPSSGGVSPLLMSKVKCGRGMNSPLFGICEPVMRDAAFSVEGTLFGFGVHQAGPNVRCRCAQSQRQGLTFALWSRAFKGYRPRASGRFSQAGVPQGPPLRQARVGTFDGALASQILWAPGFWIWGWETVPRESV
jgi:hypothetical protein